MKREYTLEEINYYEENKHRKSTKEIAKDLNRTYSSLIVKMYRIRKNSCQMPKPKEECNYEKMLEFAKKLNPNYNYMVEVFKDYSIIEFKKLYKEYLIMN